MKDEELRDTLHLIAWGMMHIQLRQLKNEMKGGSSIKKKDDIFDEWIKEYKEYQAKYGARK